MILSSSEIKQQLLDSSVNGVDQATVPDFEEKKKEYAELGNAIKRMTTTKGWKILEGWLTRQVNVEALLDFDDEIAKKARDRGRAFAMVLRQVQYWIMVGEKAEETKEENIT